MNPVKALESHGQAVWLDFLARGFIAKGELKTLIERDGVRGVTSNPAIFEKAIGGSDEYDGSVSALLKERDRAVVDLYEALAVEDIQKAADVLRPVYDKLQGEDGYVSLEVSPYLARDTDGTIAEAERLWRAVGRDNLMIKVPATREGLPAPDIQFFMSHASYGSAHKRDLERLPGMTISLGQCRPESRGSVHVKSALPGTEPSIRPNFLATELDCRTTVAGMRIARRIADHPSLERYVAHENNPGASVQSDEDLLAYARATGHTTHHPSGTCKMGHDPKAVVDDRLRVHGIAGLRVIDASVMPLIPSGNINAPTLMVAEKGADMVKEDARRLR